MTQLGVKLLGRMACELPSGQPLSLSTRKSEALLAYLAMSPGLHHSRERLVNLFWSDRGEDQARNSLRQALSSLKKILDAELPGLLEVERTTVHLQSNKISVDVDAFRLLASESEIDKLIEATQIYTGEFLEGMAIRDPAGEQWLADERATLKRLYAEVLGRLSQLQFDCSDYRSAIASAERLVSIDPLEESCWRLLMMANQGNGNRNHALMAFKRCCDVLRKELGVEPEAETTKLQQRIKDGHSLTVANKTPPTVPSFQPLAVSTNRDHSILVLPLKNLSNNDAQQYFSDGLTESIIAGLSLFPSIRVLSRNSSFAALEQGLSIEQIGQQFQVSYVVEGSVRKLQDQLRVGVQLIDSRSGEHLWGNRFDNLLEETFELEDKVTRSIVAAIKGKIELTDEEIAIRKPTRDAQSYDLLLQGYYQLQQYSPSSNHKAIEMLLKCLELEPDNAVTHNRLYQTYIVNWLGGWSAPRAKIIEEAGQHVTRALALASDDALIQADYAEYNLLVQDWEKAEKHADLSLVINPNDPEVLATVSAIYAGIGQVDKAIRLADTCTEIDPFHPWIHWVMGPAYYRNRQYHEALKTFGNMPNPADEIDGWIAACHYRLGDHEESSRYLQRYLKTCQANMAEFPKGLDEWRQYWTASASYKPIAGEDIDYPFDALCEAGLRDYVENAEKNATREIHSIAVLPFDNLSGDPEQEYFSDGITESIILNLSLFPGLNVKSRNSSFAFKAQIKSLGEISKELNVDYVVEGSIRKSSDRIRITVQLIEADSGNQIWGRRYDSDLSDLFELEEDLSRTIATTVTGQIESDLQRIAIAKGAAHQQSYDLLLQGIYHGSKHTALDIAIAIEKLHQCLALDSSNALAHATLYGCHEMNWIDRWVVDFEASRKLCKEHASQALALNPELGPVQVAFAQYLIFNHDYNEAETHLKRALEINPNDSEAIATMALKLSCQGKFENALEQARLALQLDPYHTWVRWILSESQFFSGLYDEVLATIADTGNPPGFMQLNKIAANIRLGRLETARATLKNFLQHCRENMLSMPRTIDEWRAYSRDNAPFADPALNDQLIDCMLEAGLEEEMTTAQASADPEALPSILVLPFENLSGDPEQEYVSNGMTESTILNLNSFQGLTVKSRHASFAFKDSPLSIAEIAQELDVQFVVEGSVRKRGKQIRTTVQLADTASGNQIWGKRFDTPMEDLLDLEEELVQTIAGAISGRIDRELRATSALKTASSMKSYDYLMRGWYYAERFNPEDYELSIQYLKKCVELDPENAQAHAALTAVINVLLYENWTLDREATRREADYHANRALEFDRSNALAHAFMSEHLILQHNHKKALFHAEKAIEHNPALPDGYSIKAYVLSTAREHEEAVKLAEFSLQMDPYHFYMAWNSGIVYRNAGFYKKSIDAFRSLPYPSPGIYAELAASLVGAGEIEEAREEMSKFNQLARQQMPQYPATIETWREFWRDVSGYQFDEDFESFFDLMIQAGLCDMPGETGDTAPSIAVLPFENMSGDPEQEYFSDGITTSIIMGLGMFKDLTIKSQKSSFAYRDSGKPSEEIAQDLAVDYLVEGSIRKSGNRVRVSVQLIDAECGSQIWGKQYNEQLDDIFELEQELSQTIAATISGRIGETIQQSAVRKSAKNLKSYDYFLLGLYHLGKLTARDMEIAKRQFESCLQIDPDNAMAHTNLGNVHNVEIIENWSSDLEESKRLAGIHFKTALELEPENAIAHAYIAEHFFYTDDYERSEFHADKAIELNPTMSEGYAAKADLLGFTRRIDEAVQYADKCIQLDPHSVGAGWVAAAIYRKAGLYQKAIKTFRSINHPPASVHALVSVCFANMELHQESEKEMQRYLELAKQEMPVLPCNEDDWRQLWRNNLPYQHDEDFDEFFELLVKAGLLKMAEETIYEVPSIAVLPFENMSGEAEQEYFADGITTDIIATLSKFKHIRTMSRYSILKYKTEKMNIDEIATEQGVRNILEGSVRKSGERIRVSAELIDSKTGDAVWSERYDRNLDDLFAVQDEIAKSIAVALKVHLDDGDMAMHRSAGTSNIKAWELVLTAIDLQDTYIHKNILEARSMAEEAVGLDPTYPYAWVSLGWTYWQEIYVGWGSDAIDELLLEAEQACQKAFDILPDYSEAWTLWGLIHLMKHESEQALEACRRAVELEPGNAESQALMAFACLFVNDCEQARRHNQNMLKLCPVLPNWYYLIEGETYRLEGNSAESIPFFRKGIDVEPESPLCRFYLVDALVEIGDINNAQNIADEIRALDGSANGKGLVQTFSSNEAIRESFHANLARFDLV